MEQLLQYMFLYPFSPGGAMHGSLLWVFPGNLHHAFCGEKLLYRSDDKDLVFPVLFQHTTVLPFILIEMRTSHHQYPSRSSGLAAICTFSVSYILW